MTDVPEDRNPKIVYAEADHERIGLLLNIISNAAGHTPKLNAIASEAMLELEAINAKVQAHRTEREQAKAKLEAEAKAKRDAETAKAIADEQKRIEEENRVEAARLEAETKVKAKPSDPAPGVLSATPLLEDRRV